MLCLPAGSPKEIARSRVTYSQAMVGRWRRISVGRTRERQLMLRGAGGWTVFLVIGLLMTTGCSRSPEAKKARYLERGDKYAAQEQYPEAILEYRNVLQLDEAKRELTFVLEKEPKNLEGLSLLANMATTPEEVAAAVQRLEAAQADLGDRAKFHMALGVLYLRQQDVGKAERAFQEAVAKEPTSVDAHVVLGNFYLSRRDAPQAEREFKAAAAIAPTGSLARMRLADFYLLAGRPDEAKRILTEITQKVPDFLPAWRRLAAIALRERNPDESLKVLQILLKKNPSDLEGHFLLGRAPRQARDHRGDSGIPA